MRHEVAQMQGHITVRKWQPRGVPWAKKYLNSTNIWQCQNTGKDPDVCTLSTRLFPTANVAAIDCVTLGTTIKKCQGCHKVKLLPW